ncbi:MAG: phytanoyl-CoA dioxygenase family protein [Candidatus Odyssella sp.]|nr:phytanoyl-CoA dioxygenase family protein [Candidatus Odyssella sp.]
MDETLSITVSEAERAAGALAPATNRQAAMLLHGAGCVVLRGLLPAAQIDSLATAFRAIYSDCVASRDGDAWYQVARDSRAVFWERGSRWRIFPKLRPPFDHDSLLANPIILALLADLLGPDFYCKFVSSDTCVRGSTLQAPHREFSAGGLTAPRAYIVNVPLAACTRENGALEAWPGGSHLWQGDAMARLGFDDGMQDGANDAMEALARRLPSRVMDLAPGDALIRDPGMLHRGTPNLTDAPRTMLTICYQHPDHRHDYGDPRFNVDDEIRGRLPPAVARLFARALADVEAAASTAATPARRGIWQRLRGSLARS